MSFVVDSSVTIAWCLPDEQTAELEVLREEALSQALLVPSIWPVEVANVLATAQRQGRITQAGLQLTMDILREFNFHVAASWTVQAIGSAWQPMQTYGLSAYDASYLMLALERGLPLATLDRKLASAAMQMAVPLLL